MFFVIFCQYPQYPDGTIESAIKLTGALSTGVLSFAEQSSGRIYGTSLGGSLYAPVHQHFFVTRMDFCLDGLNNRVVEMNAQRDDEINEEDNPSLNAFYYKQTVLETEQQAIRDCCPESARFWKVVSSDKTNAIGQPTGYKIVPGPKVLDVLSLHPMTHAVTRALIYLASTQPYYPYQDTLRNTHSHPSPPPLIRNTPLPRALDTSICTLGARSEPQTRGVFRPSTVGHTLLCNGKISRYPSMETRFIPPHQPISPTHPLNTPSQPI